MRQRVRMVVADLFVKVLVLLGRDVFFGARPQGAGLVHGFPFAGHHHAAAGCTFGWVVLVDRLALFPLFLFHQNRQADVVGILGDDAFELPVAGVVQRIVAQVQGHAGAALGALNAFDLKIARTATHPTHAVGRWQTGTARFDRDFVCHDEARVKTHAKLADQLRIRLLVARQLGDKVFGTAFGDGAQVVDGFLLAKDQCRCRQSSAFWLLC